MLIFQDIITRSPKNQFCATFLILVDFRSIKGYEKNDFTSKYTKRNKTTNISKTPKPANISLSDDPYELTRILCSCLESKQFNAQSAIAIIEVLKTKKLIYSEISNHLFCASRDNVANFISNIEILKEQVTNSNNPNNQEIEHIVLKLYDHTHLANHQINVFKIGREELDTQLKNSDYLNTEIKSLISKVDERIESVNSQVISLVALFTAMSFLVFGGLSSFESIFSNIQETSLLKLIVLSSVWGIAIINTIGIFMFFTSKVVGKSFNKSSSENDTLYNRYPYITLGNFILLSIFFISSFLYLYIKQFGYNLPPSLKQSIPYIIGFIGMVIVFGFAVHFIFKKKKKKKASEE